MSFYLPNTKRHLISMMLLVFLVSGVAGTVGESRAEASNDLQAAFTYISPRPGAEQVSTATAIAVRTRDMTSSKTNDIIKFTVSGSLSGSVAGETVVANDRRTTIFYPGTVFESEELVNVVFDYNGRKYHYDFQVSDPMQTGQNHLEFDWSEHRSSRIQQDIADAKPPQYRTAPGDLPTFDVKTGEGKLADGYIFMSYFDYYTVGRTKAYLLILDNKGEPVYYNDIPGIPLTMDFKKQPNGQLTYFNPLKAHQRFYALDNTYQPAGTYEAGNGYTTDLHDLQLLKNGNALLLIYDIRIMDMSAYGGKPNAAVIGCIIQEIDQDKNVVFEWRSWDHIAVTDTNQRLDTAEIRYIHCNSVEPDQDGNILLSSRNLDEITKISRESGEIIWRLGGKKSDFGFTNDIGFSVQHDARRLPNGNISVYDNGNYNNPRISRGVEYAIDIRKGTATRVSEYRGTPDIWALALGNMQKQDNGNVFIGWGRSSEPIFTEFTNDGQMVLEFNALDGTGSYRIFRFPWQGYPKWPPRLLAEADGKLAHLYFSWNGSTETTSYQLYAGQNRNNLLHLAAVPKTGFETTFDYMIPGNGLWYFQVVPVDTKGQPGQPSNLAPLVIGGGTRFLPLLTAE